MEKIIIKIKKEDLPKQRAGVHTGKIFKDKTKYSRKDKNWKNS
jgi:hypothetical protein